jgi:ATP-binding cassette subfamily F protein 3
MQSKQILQQALMQFEGTLMIVSHDRDFLDPIVNKTLEIRPGEIKTWLGDVSYYLEKTEDREKEEEATKSGNQSDSQKKLSRKEERRIEAERRNALSRKLKPLKKRLEDIESDIAAREQRKEEIEAMMAESHFYDDSDKVKEISLEYENLKMELAEKMHKWEEIAGRIEFVESEYERKQAADG